ncbi:hypothetical protein EDD56_1272 [Pseudobacteriovorax antillogorgiicola]|nr:hypothetical protein EDD56_1272 [Pseudobacteriovorax antillogorgiicola]
MEASVEDVYERTVLTMYHDFTDTQRVQGS